MGEQHVVPSVWIDAYDAWTIAADSSDGPAPDMIELPAVQLPPALVRQILKVFNPDADA
jgi:hypothetical protein